MSLRKGSELEQMAKDFLWTKVEFLTWSNEHIARNVEFKEHRAMRYVLKTYTIKPAHAVTSIKQSPVLNSHLY